METEELIETKKVSLFTIAQLRSIIKFAQSQSRELLEKVIEREWDFKAVIHSLEQEYCTVDELIKDYIFSYGDSYYSSDEYVVTFDTDNAMLKDDANYCEREGDWCEEDVVEVYVGRRSTEHWRESTAQRLCYEYDDDYYAEDALDYHNLVIMSDGSVEHSDNVYYWESDGDYHYEPEPEQEQYVRDYHYGSTQSLYFTDNPTRFIGFEIEKEDKDVKESIDIHDFEDSCPKWRKERDGSLDDNSGYELISPKFELIPSMIREHISSNETLLAHVNADKSTACGGHINVSEINLDGAGLFELIKGYTPLFYALYYKRVDKNYCKGKKNTDLVEDNDKYQAIKIHSNRIEFRIVSAVPNLDTLMWRARLIEFMLDHKTSCVKEAFFNINTSPLKDLLLEMYPDRFDILIQRVIDFSLKFENINLK
jgi:hypothetical protein